jgi:hypothetical protein
MEITNQEEGRIEGARSVFLKIVNHGTLHLDQCMMQEEVISFGTLLAKETQFQDLIVNGGKSTLTSCQIEKLVISSEKQTLPTVILSGSTVVRGSVEFKEGPGVVYKGPDVIISGPILNGKIRELKE